MSRAAPTFAIAYMSAYVTGKAALIRWTETLAAETRQHGVSVFSIQPGTAQTTMARQVLILAVPLDFQAAERFSRKDKMSLPIRPLS